MEAHVVHLTEALKILWRLIAFNKFKKLMVEAPVLTMPGFIQPFVLETDACSNGIRVVLMQNEQLIAFFFKAFVLEIRLCLHMRRSY